MPSAGGDNDSFFFGVLGPVRIWRRGTELDPGPRQQRLMLALLLAGGGQPVGLGDIVEVLWDRRPPPSAVNVVHRYVGALRRLFEPGLPARASGRWLLGDAAGYRMRVDAGNLDLLQFRRLAEQGRGERAAGRLPAALASFEQALSLWRGPCGGVSELASSEAAAFSVVDHECADLAREAMSVALGLERSRSILPVLRRMAGFRPWDEALQAQLLLALSADGQQAEAIALFQVVRRRLAEELGVDPGDELREAYELTLRQPSRGELTSAGSPEDRMLVEPAVARAVLPAQLPADLPWFTGRDEIERWSLGLVNGHVLTQVSTPVLAIDGLPGVGKTSLAVHLAHQLADVYPDGQLYVDLQGFDPGQSVLHPAEALQGFLNALGVPDGEIPTSPHARAGLYRSVLAGRRLLVVLDNAHSVKQVRPLLPGAPGCVVLVTSRKRLTGLATAHGAHLMTLDVLSVPDARRFLVSRVGEARAAADAGAVDEIVGLCGRLPLALSVVASRALTHPEHRLAEIARELREAQGSLDGFSDDDMSNDIRGIFSWSYRMLGGSAARLFRLLALHPGPDISVPAMASLAGVPLGEARVLAGELAGTGLILEHIPGRFVTHDLVRAYAHELVQEHDEGPERERAVDRLVHHYRLTAYEATSQFDSSVMPDRPAAREGVTVTPLTDAAGAVAWFNADRQVLKAVVQRLLDDGGVAPAWRLVMTLQRFHQSEGWWHDWAAMTRACLQAATAAGDDLGRAYMARSLAGAESMLEDFDSAAQLLRQSLELFRRLGLEREQALVYRNLGQVSIEQGRPDESVDFLERALRLFEKMEDRREQVVVLYVLAEAHVHLGRPDISMGLANRALPIAESMNDTLGIGLTYEALAMSSRAEGDLETSLVFWQRASKLYEQYGWRVNWAESLRHQGDVAIALGDRASARAAWEQALELLVNQHVPQVAEIEARLTELAPSPAVRPFGNR